jgi:hypothetical protein
MPSMTAMLAYMAPQPSLPVVSLLAITGGMVLMFGRDLLRLVRRWVRPAAIRGTRDQGIGAPHSRPGGRSTDADHSRRPGSARSAPND